jgi:REP element-mobilizing transposase RayT
MIMAKNWLEGGRAKLTREFLLKFSKDRRRWLQWLYEARRRYGLPILNYMATSNHIHLLVVDDGDRDVIPNSMKLIAGRTGQEYNQRKNRKGAFWEDRYHATAVERGDHLFRCLVYIDLNMVRALLGTFVQKLLDKLSLLGALVFPCVKPSGYAALSKTGRPWCASSLYEQGYRKKKGIHEYEGPQRLPFPFGRTS